ncbi:MAG TPA: ATP-binding cassette domain-containing protein [Candidatus Angelobacter sp.]
MKVAIDELPVVEHSVETPSNTAIRVENLWKRYGSVEAVRGVSFEVRRGEIFGLIGPDGAGKTSTFQILAGVMEATGGRAEVFGKSAREARAETGYLTQSFSLYPDLSVMENIRYVGDLRLVPPEEIKARAQKYLSMFGMERFPARLAGRLSGGMKQKLALACALVPQPKVLLLDEPTTGVDPVSRREFWDALAHLAADGLTIMVATPYLDEAERCHRIALMYQGEIHQSGPPAEVRASLRAKRLELRTPQLSRTEQVLSPLTIGNGSVMDVQRFGDRIDLLVNDPQAAQQEVQKKLDEEHIPVQEFHVDNPTLENTFVARLRSLRERIEETPFPARHDHRSLRGQIAIGADHLVRKFGDFTAVNDVSLDVRYGEVYGLLGANGAGKTTTIKMLCGLLGPTSGSMQLAGESSGFRSVSVRRRIGYMSQKFSLYDDLTIQENLEFFSGVYGVPESERQEKIDWVLSFSNLKNQQNQITGSLPGGWKQRVAFGAATMHEPPILFLDEPTSGVDPLARRSFWTMINSLADAGAAVLVTTHYLEEAEQCNRLGLMVAGKLVVEGTPSGIKSREHGHLWQFIVNQPQRASDLLRSQMERWRVSLFGDRLHVITDDERGRENIRHQLESYGIRVLSIREDRFSLEDVFISIVEKARLQGEYSGEE